MKSRLIPVAVSGCTEGLIFDPTGGVCHVWANEATNWSDVKNKKYVNYGVIRRKKSGEFRFVETSGFTRESGTFFDTY